MLVGVRGGYQKGGRSAWLCQCDCGNTIITRVNRLVRGESVSCGCRNPHYKNGLSTTPLYGIWRGMLRRCNDSTCKSYKYYGALGVTVCERWATSFETFVQDVGPRPTPQHSIDRYPNNSGNYEPGNVRWATPLQQTHNRRTTRSTAPLRGENAG
jgi:hypothetical protein